MHATVNCSVDGKAKPFRSMDGAHFKKQTFTVCVNRISHRNWNRGRNGLPHFLCTILFTHTAYQLPVCTPICAHSKPQVSRVKSHFWGNQVTIGKWAVQGLKQPYFIEFTCYSAKARLIVPTGTIQNTASKEYITEVNYLLLILPTMESYQQYVILLSRIKVEWMLSDVHL